VSRLSSLKVLVGNLASRKIGILTIPLSEVPTPGTLIR